MSAPAFTCPGCGGHDAWQPWPSKEGPQPAPRCHICDPPILDSGRFGPAPTVTLHEALRSPAAQAERDRQLAAWCGLAGDEAEAFVRRVAEFDAGTPGAAACHRAWDALEETLEAEELRRRVADSRPAMLARVDAVIADLVDQLVAGGYFDRGGPDA